MIKKAHKPLLNYYPICNVTPKLFIGSISPLSQTTKAHPTTLFDLRVAEPPPNNNWEWLGHP